MKSQVFDSLWSPLTVGEVTVPNRIVVAAHTTGFRGEQYAAYLAARARGGAGLLITGAGPVHPTAGNEMIWRTYERDAIPEMREVVAAVHAENRPIFFQLGHAGIHYAGADSLADWGLAFGPSPTPSQDSARNPKVMDRADISTIVQGFALSAGHAQEAGADGVEVHAAHGYLLSQFLSPLSNQRSDEYGGSSTDRARIVLEVGEAIRATCGSGFAIGLKLNFDDHLGAAGITPADAEASLRILHAARLFDYFGISGATNDSFHYMVAPESSGLAAHFAPYAETARRVVGQEVPVMVTGRIRTIAQAAEIVERGQADLVGMIRAHIADPAVVRKSQAGRGDEVQRCVGANQGCWRRVAGGRSISCTVNPTAGREALWETTRPARRPRRILVVGGGPAGMKFAEIAAARGHHVTLVERDSRLGGQINYAGALPHRAGWSDFVDDLGRSIDRLGVDVRLDQEVTAADAWGFGADVVVVATGSTWDESGWSPANAELPSVPRSADSRVWTPIEAIRHPEACGTHVVVVDGTGDYLPLGLAEYLANAHRRVSIVTSDFQVGSRLGANSTVDFAWIYPRLIDAGVQIEPCSQLVRIEGRSVVLNDVWTRQASTLEADTVIFCGRRVSDDSLYHDLDRNELDVRRIGDCVAPREVDDALVEAAREANAVP